jgi:hypothetical protein
MEAVMRALLVLLLLVSFTPGVLAQSRPVAHRGAWISLGYGADPWWSTCLRCERAERTVPANDLGDGGYIAVGGTLNSSVLLGAQVDFWGRQRDSEEVVLFSGIVQGYPLGGGGLYLKGGVGAGTSSPARGDTQDRHWGVGLIAGTGYDLRLYRAWIVSPYLHYVRLTPGRDSPAEKSTLQFGLALSWY